MKTELSRTLGIEHAIFGFTPFPAVAAALTRAGGFGVLGAVRYTAPDDLARDLDWMQEHTDGLPYGLDVVMPAKKVEGLTEAEVEAMIPEEHRAFVRATLAKHGVPELPDGEASGWRITGWMEQVARNQLDVAFDYPIKLLANALGSPPADVVARAHDHGVLVAAPPPRNRVPNLFKEAGPVRHRSVVRALLSLLREVSRCASSAACRRGGRSRRPSRCRCRGGRHDGRRGGRRRPGGSRRRGGRRDGHG